VELLRACCLARPDEPVFRRNLGEALVRLARQEHEDALAEAVAHLGEALELVPEREDAPALRALLERWTRELAVEEGHWTEASDVFVLSYDPGREDLLRHSELVLRTLEGIYEELRAWFGTDPVRGREPRRPIRVVLLDREGFGRVTGLGDWAGGAFDGDVRVPIEDLAGERDAWERTLRHELVHAFVHAVGGADVPGWLNEGLAQWLGGAPDERGQARRRLRAALDAGAELPALEGLHGSLTGWDDADAIALAYAQSLALVDHIARHYGDAVLLRMVQDARLGLRPETSFERASGVSFALVLVDLRNSL
jgi:hypothetical protein